MGIQFARFDTGRRFAPIHSSPLDAILYSCPPSRRYSSWIDVVNPAFHFHRRFDGNLRINLRGYAQIRPNAFGAGGRAAPQAARRLGDVNGLCAVTAPSLPLRSS